MEGENEKAAGGEAEKKGVGPGNGEGSKATRFQKGRGRPPGSGNKEPLLVPVPQQLKDMRYVYGRKAGKGTNGDRTNGQKSMRRFLDESPGQFMAQMTKLEAEYKADVAKAKAGVDSSVTLPRGEAERKLVGVIEELLAQYPGA